jgi:hypothetical protein
MDAYGAAAEKLANAAFRNGIPASLVTCKPSVRCRAEFIRILRAARFSQATAFSHRRMSLNGTDEGR